jgi:16S rRNA (cytosine967-C5)-methyltransferase
MPSEARGVAFAVLRRTFEQGAFTDRAFQAAAADLPARERALAMRLAYGAVQRRATVDHLIERASGRPVAKLDPLARAALRLGAYELAFTSDAPHAAVNDAVSLAGPSRGKGLVNAVLRRIAREAAALLAELDDRTPQGAALLHSMPLWIVEEWWDDLGAGETRALLATVNEPAEHAVRANQLVGDAPALVEGLDVRALAPGDPPEAVILLEPFDVHGSRLWREGRLMPQSRASMLPARALDPQPGERVLDMCAAPGAKTSQIAALMGNAGSITALERNPGRAQGLERTLLRMHVSIATVEVRDATMIGEAAGGYDRVLLDAPCSGLGTIRSRPDLRWRASRDRVQALAGEQARLLSAAARALTLGGTLVYSTCTVSRAENERQIQTFLDRHPQFESIDLTSRMPGWSAPRASPWLLALPHVQGSDGFFVAALRRER